MKAAVMDVSSSQKMPVRACPICGARRFCYQFSIGPNRVVRCKDCNFALLNPQPSDDELAAIYRHDYFIGAGRSEKETAFAQLKLDTAEAYLDRLTAYAGITTGKLVEIGSGSGAMLLAAARRGFAVTGVEYSAHACETARRRLAGAGLQGEVVCGEIDAIAHREGTFDACVLADVVEHVRNPRQFIALIHRVLKPGGAILIATPSLDSWSAKVMSARWMEFKPEHLSYFSRKTLEALLFSEGFRHLAWEPGGKILNYDYIREHFEKFPVPVFTPVVRAVGACLPKALRSRPLRLVASGMLVMGRRDEKRARPRLSVIVPVYNEAATFAAAFDRVLAHPLPSLDVEYIVVESNSTDGTREQVLKYDGRPGICLILEDRPRGKGYAVREGLRAATGDFVLIQDADLEYDVDDYDALLEPLLANRGEFVLGARHGGRAWKMREFVGQPMASMLFNLGHWFFTALLNVCYFVRLKDPFTMYKVFRRDCIHGLPFECNRFDFDWEIVIKLIKRGYVPVEIPVNYHSRSFKEGKKVSVLRDPLTWLWAVARFRFVRYPRWAPPESVGRAAPKAPAVAPSR